MPQHWNHSRKRRVTTGAPGKDAEGTQSRLIKLERYSFRELATGGDQIYSPSHLACSKNASNPWGYVATTIAGNVVKMFATKKVGENVGPLDIVAEYTGPAGKEARFMPVDDEGACYILFASHYNTAGVEIHKLTPKLIYGGDSEGITVDAGYTSSVLDHGGNINFADYLCYDSATDSVIVAGGVEYLDGGTLVRIGAQTGFCTGVIRAGQNGAPSQLCSFGNNASAFKRGPGYGKMVVKYNNNFNLIDTRSFVCLRTIDAVAYGASPNGFVYDPSLHAILCADMANGGVSKLPLDRVSGDGYPVASILTELCSKTGLQASDLDVTQITDTVPGYIVARPMTVRQAIEPLMSAFFFDVAETSARLKFVKRGAATALTIAFEDLAAHEDTGGGGASPDPVTTTRIDEKELPGTITVEYMLASLNYEQDAKRAKREVVRTQQTTDVQLPMVLGQDQAAQIAEVLLFNAWMERTTFSFSTSRKNLRLEPCDVIQVVSQEGDIHTMRVVKLEYGFPGLLHIDAVRDRPSVYNPVAPAGDVPDRPTQTVDYEGPTMAFILDIPALRDADANNGVYFAATGYMPTGWTGCGLYESKDAGATWDMVSSTTVRAMVGFAINALPDGPPTVWDEWSTITVRMVNGADVLETVTEAQVLGGANAAYLQGEVIQWQTATLNADGSYTLSRLLRGRKGTDYATAGHKVGDTFILLDPHYISRVTMLADEIGKAMLYKAPSNDQTIAEAQQIDATYQAAALKPLSPVHIKGQAQANGDVLMTWVRRDRLDGEWRDNVETGLSEASERYTVEVKTMAGAIVRTVEGLTSPAYTYPAADKAADIGTGGFLVTVYQISAIVGRGFPGHATISAT